MALETGCEPSVFLRNVSSHLESDYIDSEGIELLRSLFTLNAKAGNRNACMILALCEQVERLRTENQRLRNHLENIKPVDYGSILKTKTVDSGAARAKTHRPWLRKAKPWLGKAVNKTK